MGTMMSYTIDWLAEQRIILLDVTGEVTIDEIMLMQLGLYPLMREEEVPVHCVVDATKTVRVLADLPQLGRIRVGDVDLQHGWVLIVCQSPTIRFLAYFIAGLSGGRIRVCNSVVEALAFLTAHDSTLKLDIARAE
jgi:hypothetical protein